MGSTGFVIPGKSGLSYSTAMEEWLKKVAAFVFASKFVLDLLRLNTSIKMVNMNKCSK